MERSGEIAALYGTAEATGVDSMSHAVVEVDWSEIDWVQNNRDRKPGQLISVGVLAKQGDTELVRTTVRPFDDKGAFLLPQPTRIYCKRNKGPATLDLDTIVLGSDGKKSPKKWTAPEDIRKSAKVTPLVEDFK